MMVVWLESFEDRQNLPIGSKVQIELTSSNWLNFRCSFRRFARFDAEWNGTHRLYDQHRPRQRVFRHFHSRLKIGSLSHPPQRTPVQVNIGLVFFFMLLLLENWTNWDVLVSFSLQDQHGHSSGRRYGRVKTHFGASGAANGAEYGQTPTPWSREVQISSKNWINWFNLINFINHFSKYL